VDLYGRVRHAVLVDGMSRREAARIFGINRRTVEKMLMRLTYASFNPLCFSHKKVNHMTQAVRTAIFPVAGLGTRFLPATKATPKELLPVLDTPLIQYAIDEARAAGVERSRAFIVRS
jgi:hypothetical protein